MTDLNLEKHRPVYLVTGGAGFIGTNLCIRLLRSDVEVVCLDNLSSGTEANVEMLYRYDGFRFVKHDICEPYSHVGALDAVINLACPASPVFYQADAVATTKTCVLGTLNMLALAREHGCIFLQSSTSEVYGDAQVTPQTEEYWGNVNPNGIRSCYDEGKRCAESLCLDCHRMYGQDVKIVRIFNTYGPHMRPDDGRVVSNLICQAFSGEAMTVYGDGSQTRSFLYVDDLVEGILRMLATPKHVTGPVNLGNPCEMTIGELAERVKNITGSSSAINHCPLPLDDPKRRRPDITLARQMLDGWQPEVNLQEGLEKTIEYFRH